MDEGNTLLIDEDIEMIFVLHINSEFMEFMQSIYGNCSRQKSNVTIIRSDDEEYSVIGFKFIGQMKTVLLCTII